MPADHEVSRLPGTRAHVVTDHDGSTVLRTAAGRFLRVQGPPLPLAQVLAGTAAGSDDTEEVLAHLGDEITSRELADARERWPADKQDVALVGTGPVIDAVAAALEGWGLSPRRFASAPHAVDSLADTSDQSAAGGRPNLVIACADTLGDRAGWLDLDRLPLQGTAWLRAHREGEVCYVDPLSTSPHDAGSDQVLRRRLAASIAPGPFAVWHAAEPQQTGPLQPAATLLVSARLLTVAVAWARGGAEVDEYRRTLWKLVPATGQVTQHTVLGYDAPHVPASPAPRR